VTTTRDAKDDPDPWCRICGAAHLGRGPCPGSLLATGVERHGWRVMFRTSHGNEVYGVLVAPVDRRWRARIITYPRTLWTVPGGGVSMKFLGDRPSEAERLAIDYVEAHCERRGYRRVDAAPLVDAVDIDPEGGRHEDGGPPPRKPSSVPVRFGFAKLTDTAVTGDLSEEGMFVVTECPAPVGTTLKLQLELEAARIPLRGIVRWRRDQNEAGRPRGMGIQLIRVPALYVHYARQLP
jgi:hypothetical protein